MDNKTIALFGSETVPIIRLVRKQDGTTDQISESVAVQVLPVKKFPTLAGSLEDEYAMAEIFCDKPKGWADDLTNDSLEAIITKGEALNDDFFSRWARRRLARQEKLMPGVTERLALASRNGLQK